MLASSGSLDGITKLISQYFYGSTINLIESGSGFDIYNKKGILSNFKVTKKGNKYIFLEKPIIKTTMPRKAKTYTSVVATKGRTTVKITTPKGKSMSLATKKALVKRVLSQTGSTNKDFDKRVKAMAPGYRVAKKSGRVYRETMANRSDLNSKGKSGTWL